MGVPAVVRGAVPATAALLTLDDLHWAEPTFLALLEHLVEAGDGPMARWMALAQTGLLLEQLRFPPRPRRTRADSVIEGLPAAETESLVDELFGGAPAVHTNVRARVVEGENEMPCSSSSSSRWPRKGTRSVRSRSSRPRSRRCVGRPARAGLAPAGCGGAGACGRDVGREFATEHVTALLDPVAVPTVARHLSSLTRRGFVEPRARGGLRFRHVLVQDAAYRAAPKKLRSELHERLADKLDDDGTAADELVGYHLERAYRLRTELAPPDRAASKLAEDAGRRLGDAGARAWQRHDAPAALNLLERATELLPKEDTRRLELLCELGSVLKWRMDDQRAATALEEVAAAASAARNDRLRLRAELELAWPRFVHGHASADAILELTERAIPVFASVDDDRALGQAWLVAAAVHGPIRLRWGPCEEAALRSLDHYRRARFSTTACVSMLAAAAKNGPRPIVEAIARCEELVTSPASDRSSIAHMRVYLADLETMQGNPALAREHLRTAHEYISAQGGSTWPDWTHVAAALELLDGDAAAALAIVEGACAQLEALGERAWVSTLTALSAEAYYAQGRLDDALDASGKARALAPADDLLAQVTWRRARAKACARTGDLAAGRRLAMEAIGLLDASDHLVVRATTLLDLSEVLHLAGRHPQASAFAEEALALLDRKGVTAGLERARRLARSPSGRIDATGGRVDTTLPRAGD